MVSDFWPWVIFALVLLEIGLFGLVNWLRRDFQWLLVKSDENPRLDAAGLEKFIAHGFDPELGWIRKPNTSGREVRLGRTTSYSISQNGARHNPSHEQLQTKVATFGDSFAFAREVNDNETWQWHLSEHLGANVVNFGVGNYGIDQGILRFLREYPDTAPEIVVQMAVPETITRIYNMWKHYSEYGNTFGFKPRFTLNDGRIELIRNPVDSVGNLAHYQQFLQEIKNHDWFYKNKFRRDVFQFPYLVSMTKNPRRNLPLIFALLTRKIWPKSFADVPYNIVTDRNFKIVRAMFADPECRTLFSALLAYFAEHARRRGTIPVFIMVPYLQDLEFQISKRSYYDKFLSEANSIDGLVLYDPTDDILACESWQQLYANDKYGGHLTAQGNQVLAELIYDHLKSKNVF